MHEDALVEHVGPEAVGGLQIERLGHEWEVVLVASAKDDGINVLAGAVFEEYIATCDVGGVFKFVGAVANEGPRSRVGHGGNVGNEAHLRRG